MGFRMIFLDFSRALAQLSDPRFRRVIFLGIGLTIGLLAAIYALLVLAVGLFAPETVTLPLLGEVTWVRDLLSWGSLFLMLGLSVFLMIPVASAMSGFFLDDIAEAVEDAHYPGLPTPPRPPLMDALRDALTFLGVLIGANILAFGAYLLFPFAAPLIFYGLNGYLLGREYFQMATIRREGRSGADSLRKLHTVQIWAAGCLMAVPLTVPLLNLLVPVLGAATFTHLYHRVAAKG